MIMVGRAVRRGWFACGFGLSEVKTGLGLGQGEGDATAEAVAEVLEDGGAHLRRERLYRRRVHARGRRELDEQVAVAGGGSQREPGRPGSGCGPGDQRCHHLVDVWVLAGHRDGLAVGQGG
jgi:hypothetical protein